MRRGCDRSAAGDTARRSVCSISSAASPIAHLLTSPDLRCRQTLEPLAAQRGLPVRLDARLAAGRSAAGALALLDELERPRRRALLAWRRDPARDRAPLRRGPAPRARAGLRQGLRLDRGRRARSPRAGALRGAARQGRASPASPRSSSTTRRRSSSEKLRVAVLDLGSTSFHLLVADATPTGEIRRVLREREMLRLGALVASGGRIPEAVCARAVEAARQLHRRAVAAHAEPVLAVATVGAARRAQRTPARPPDRRGARHAGARALRRAGGAPDLRGLPPAAGDPRRARTSGSISAAAASRSRSATTATSTGRRRCRSVSRACTASSCSADPMPRAARDAIRARVRGSLAGVARELARRRPLECIGAGGTLSALARRIVTRRTSWPARGVNQLFLPVSELREVAAELVASTHDERLRMPGLQKQRADLLPTGAVVLEMPRERARARGHHRERLGPARGRDPRSARARRSEPSGSGRVPRQREGEGRAAPELALDLDLAAEALDQVLHDREAEPGAAL